MRPAGTGPHSETTSAKAAEVTPAWSRWAACVVFAGAVWMAFVAFRHLGAEFTLAKPWAMLIELAIGLIVVPPALRTFRGAARSDRPAEPVFLVVCIAVFAVTRLLMLRLIPTLPTSDFAAYHDLAQLLASGAPLPPDGARPLFFAWGYSLLLAPWYAVLGDGLIVAKLLNLAAGIAALLLLYPLAKAAGGMAVGRGAVILYILWPAQLFLTPVLASEHCALLFCLAGLLCALAVIQRQRNVGLSLVGGLSLGLACVLRPALGVVLPVTLLVILTYTPRRRAALVAVGVWVIAFAGIQAGCRGYVQSVYQRWPPTVAWWNLMAGMSYEARGQWNQPDADAFFSRATPALRDRFARTQIFHRAAHLGWRWPNHIRRKLELLWGDNYYGLWWATRELGDTPTRPWLESQLPRLFTWSQMLHLASVILCARGLYLAFRRPHGAAVTLMLLLILSGTALHGVFETQSRYSHVFAIGALLFAAMGLVGTPPTQCPEHRRRGDQQSEC